MIGSSASVLVEYDRAERWLSEGIDYAESVDLWNHRSYMTAHLAHVRWAVGRMDDARELAELALAGGQGGITTRITAEYVLGYVAMSRGEWASAVALLSSALALGESMAELQRVSPPLWGLAETALLCEQFETAVSLCDRGFEFSADVTDAAYLFPFLVTGTRARLALSDIDGADDWRVRVAAVLTARNIPGTMPALEHAAGLVLLARGDVDGATESLRRARTAWEERQRFWSAQWAALDEARCAFKARRHLEGLELTRIVGAAATSAGAFALAAAADRLAEGQQGTAAWYPLSAREYDVAQLIAEGLTNREIGARLFVSPKTISAHVEHILAKLGAGRRAEIAAWTERIK